MGTGVGIPIVYTTAVDARSMDDFAGASAIRAAPTQAEVPRAADRHVGSHYGMPAPP